MKLKLASLLRTCLIVGALIAGAFWFYGLAGALAQDAPTPSPSPSPTPSPTPTPVGVGPTAAGTCGVLTNGCAVADKTFSPTSIKISVLKDVTTLTCTGTTTVLPTKLIKCDGEALSTSGGGTESNPSQGCVITLGTTPLSPTDDWSETITKAGKVTLICKSGGTDTK